MKLKCPICNSLRDTCFSASILRKYEVTYLYCSHCGLLQTEEPYWLEEAYSSAIADADTGLVSRNISISKKLSTLLYFNFDRQASYLDIAGGYGMLTRLMRDIGFDFYWHDLYCQNNLARGFERDKTVKPFDVITAFEVLEHVANPLEFIKESLSDSGASTIIFSTELFQGAPPQPTDWSYYVLNTGQHISFYQIKTLKFIANLLSLTLYSSGDIHMLTTEKIAKTSFELMMKNSVAEISSLYIRKKMKSKVLEDYQKILNS